MTEHILIAGCGDLGQRAAARLIAQGHVVWGLRRDPPCDPDDGLRWIAADMTDPATLGGLPAQITRVVFSATPAARDEAAYRAVFIDGPRNVLTALAAAPLRRTVFVSSSAVYGEHGGAWVDENTEPDPPGFNGRVLLEAERALAHAPGCVVLRLAGLYGPGRLQLVERVRGGRARAPRHPPHWVNRMHIDDAAAAVAHLTLLESASGVYIGADDTPLPMHELYGHLAERVGAPPVPEGPPPAGIGSKRLCNDRLRSSGLVLRWPDARAGYAALLADG